MKTKKKNLSSENSDRVLSISLDYIDSDPNDDGEGVGSVESIWTIFEWKTFNILFISMTLILKNQYGYFNVCFDCCSKMQQQTQYFLIVQNDIHFKESNEKGMA